MSGVHDDLATLGFLLHGDLQAGEVLKRVEDEIARLERRLESTERWKRAFAAGRAGLVEQADQDFARAEAAEAEVARLRGEIDRIRDNARAWHGTEGKDSGHERALAVIASWCDRALLAEDGAA